MEKGYHRLESGERFEGKFSDTDETIKQLESKPVLLDEDILKTPTRLGVEEDPKVQIPLQEIIVDKGPHPKKIKRGPSWKQHLLALGATLGLNTAGVLTLDKGLRGHLIEDGRGALARATETDAEKAALAKQAIELLEQKDKEKIVQERLELFLKVLAQRGGVSEEDIVATRDFFHGVQDEFKKVVEKQEDDDEEKKSTLFELVKKFGRYDVHFARLSDVAQKQKFNCDVLAQSLLVTIPAMYPDMMVKLQWFGGDTINVPHVRVVVKIAGKWYAIEKNGPEELSLKDIKGTIITGPEAFERSLVENVGEGAPPGMDVLSADSNSVFGISFVNAKVFEGGSTKEETTEEYQARMRSQYVGGKPLDPQNLPPLTLYMGNSVEEVSMGMGGVGSLEDQKIVDTLNPEDPHPLPEEISIKAIMEGDLDLSQGDVFYDLSSLSEIQIDSIYFWFRKNENVNKKFIAELQKRFSTIKEFSGVNTGRTVQSTDWLFLRNFPLLESLDIKGITDISFLEGNTHLSSVKFMPLDKGVELDISSLRGATLESLELWQNFRNSSEINLSRLKRLAVSVDASHMKEAETLMAKAPVLEDISWVTKDKNTEVPFSYVQQFTTKRLRNVYIDFRVEGDHLTKVDFHKLRGQPLEMFFCFGVFANIQDLRGDLLTTLAMEWDGISFESMAVKFPQLRTLRLTTHKLTPTDFGMVKNMKNLKEFSWYEGAGVSQFSKQNLEQMSGLRLEVADIISTDGIWDFTADDVAHTIMNTERSNFFLNQRGSFSDYDLKNGILTETP